MTGRLHKHIILRTVLVFLAAFLLSFFIWIQVKDHYSYAVTIVSSKLVGGIKDVRLDSITPAGDIIEATFTPLRGRGRSDMLVDIPVKTSSYTFNVPLTLGIMASLYGFIKRKWRAYSEALGILLLIHILYVISLEANLITEIFMERGLEAVSPSRLFVYQFIWGFTDNMAIRFEPFLIGCYLFLRFRRSPSSQSIAP